MRGLIVEAGTANSAQLVSDLPEPDPAEGSVLVEGLAVGICGTDREIVAGLYGEAPGRRTPSRGGRVEPGRRTPSRGGRVEPEPGSGNRLVLGHESLGRVISDDSDALAPGDLVAAIVRRPDPVPCANCAVGEWDMCHNEQYTECGIKQRDGFARERWRVDPAFAVRLDPALAGRGVLLEPTSVVAKAWEHIQRIGERARWQPRTVLVTGAGPIGLLAALLGVQRGHDVHVVDVQETGPKPGLVRNLGATYHTGSAKDAVNRPDIVLECTGVNTVIVDVLDLVGPGGIICLTGVSTGGHPLTFDIGQTNRNVVLENNVVFGSVNANLRHWLAGADALSRADPDWLDSLLTRRVALADFADALKPSPGDVKVVLDLTV